MNISNNTESRKIEKILPSFFKLPEKIRFILALSTNISMSYLVFLVLYWLIPINYQLVLAISFLISSFPAFTNYKIFVFKTRGNWLKEYLRALGSMFFLTIANTFILHAFVEWLLVAVPLAQAISVAIVSIISYSVHKFFSFKMHTKT